MGGVSGGLVLAAGAGSRYGMPKALVPYPDRLLVQRAADTLRAAGVDEIVIVLGAEAGRVRAEAPDLPPTVINQEWRSGLGSSLRVGLTALRSAESAVVLLVDMPGVTAQAVRRVLAHSSPDALAMGGYDGGRRGHPVLLGRAHWAGVIETATGDSGARDYLRTREVRVVPVGDVADDLDLDLPELNPHSRARS